MTTPTEQFPASLPELFPTSHAPSTGPRFEWSKCSQIFVQKSSLNRHNKLRRERRNGPQARGKKFKGHRAPTSPLPAPAISCSMCCQVFKSKSGLCHHNRTRLERGTCPLARGKNFKGHREPENVRDSTALLAAKYLCLYPRCTASFDTKTDMLKHINQYHHAFRPWSERYHLNRCPEGCGARMANMNPLSFATHLEHKHSMCAICCFPCANNEELAEHMREKHTILESPYQCPMRGCDCPFESFEDLLLHYWRSNDHPRALCLEKVESFQSLHRPVGVGLSDPEKWDFETTTSSIETTTDVGTYNSVETYTETLTNDSSDWMSVDSIQRTDEVSMDELQPQTDRVRKAFSHCGIDLCDTPEDCYSCTDLITQISDRLAGPQAL